MSVYQDIYWRELGDVRSRGDPLTLRRDVLGSKYLLETYALKGVLAGHTGCVNSVLFSYDGGCIYTGSDDRNVNIYDTESLKLIESLTTVHTNNIFYARDMPGTDRNLVLTCAADGRVILTNMTTKGARRMHRHKGRAHRIALVPFENDQFYSCGEDGVCCLFDIRDSASRLFSSEAGMSALEENVFAPAMTTQFKNNRNKVASIYTVGVNPLRSYQVALGGSSNHISLYDSRKFTEPVSYLCPESLASSTAHVTGLKYDHTGEMLIGSYNDDDVYSFQLQEHTITTRRAASGALRTRSESMDSTEDSIQPEPDASSPGYYRKYSGHRNNNTVKQVVFMGGRSDFVISGSDCGHLFIWDTHTAEVVQLLKADQRGAINCLAPHPVLPMLATSGLENDAKVWFPTGERKPIAEGTEKKKLLTRVASRNAERNERSATSNSLMELIMSMMQYNSNLPLHDSGDDRHGEGGESTESGSEDSGGDGSAGSAGSEESWDESWGDGEGEGERGEEGEENGEMEGEEMDTASSDDEEGEEERSLHSDEMEVAPPRTSTGRDRWTRPAPRTTNTTATADMNTVDAAEGGGEDSDSAEYGPQPVPAQTARRHRHHRHRHHRHHRRRARPNPDALTPPPESEAEEDSAEEMESGAVSMQDIFEGRVGIVIDGVEVPWSQLARLMPALLGRRRRTPSDTGDEERDGSDGEAQEEEEEEEEDEENQEENAHEARDWVRQTANGETEEEDLGELVEVEVKVKVEESGGNMALVKEEEGVREVVVKEEGGVSEIAVKQEKGVGGIVEVKKEK